MRAVSAGPLPPRVQNLLPAHVQELEAQNKRLIEAQTEVSGRPADFLPRAEHQRILTARLDQAAVQQQSEMRAKLDQAGRDLKWRLEAQASEQEASFVANLHQVRRLPLVAQSPCAWL